MTAGRPRPRLRAADRLPENSERLGLKGWLGVVSSTDTHCYSSTLPLTRRLSISLEEMFQLIAIGL